MISVSIQVLCWKSDLEKLSYIFTDMENCYMVDLHNFVIKIDNYDVVTISCNGAYYLEVIDGASIMICSYLCN